MLNDIFLVFGSMFLVVVGSILGYYARQTIARGQLGSIEQKIAKATAEAETKAREIIIAAKDKAEKALEAVKLEEKEGLKKLDELEDRLVKRQENLDRRIESYEAKEGDLQEKIEKVKQIKSEIEALREKERETLEKIAGFTLEQAKENLLKTVEEKYRQDILDSTVRLEKLRGEELERKALELMVTAIHRYSRSHVSDVMTSMVSLPNEDLKGKIIGREGRNIRTLERLTGVEIIVDETPDAITISGYDPIRREAAKTALEKLIKDGGIEQAHAGNRRKRGFRSGRGGTAKRNNNAFRPAVFPNQFRPECFNPFCGNGAHFCHAGIGTRRQPGNRQKGCASA